MRDTCNLHTSGTCVETEPAGLVLPIARYTPPIDRCEPQGTLLVEGLDLTLRIVQATEERIRDHALAFVGTPPDRRGGDEPQARLARMQELAFLLACASRRFDVARVDRAGPGGHLSASYMRTWGVLAGLARCADRCQKAADHDHPDREAFAHAAADLHLAYATLSAALLGTVDEINVVEIRPGGDS